jgi:putative SOS response-associated peptidase YedK
MCYSVAQMQRKKYLTAVREGYAQEIIDQLYEDWQKSQREDSENDVDSPMAFVNGFDHPKSFCLHKETSLVASRMTWGLIPSWVKDRNQANEIRNKTLNARGESIFEKPAFQSSIREKRCLIFVDGFYEYYHFKRKTFPHFIQLIDETQPLIFGGIWDEWVDQDTAEIVRSTSIVTTEANPFMREIHNNPKANGARMPLILAPTDTDQWLNATNDSEIKELIKPMPNQQLKAHTVIRNLHKNIPIEAILEEYIYPELFVQGTLF